VFTRAFGDGNDICRGGAPWTWGECSSRFAIGKDSSEKTYCSIYHSYLWGIREEHIPQRDSALHTCSCRCHRCRSHQRCRAIGRRRLHHKLRQHLFRRWSQQMQRGVSEMVYHVPPFGPQTVAPWEEKSLNVATPVKDPLFSKDPSGKYAAANPASRKRGTKSIMEAGPWPARSNAF